MTRRLIPAAEKAQAEVDRLQRKYDAAVARREKASREQQAAADDCGALSEQLAYAKAHPALRLPASDAEGAASGDAGR